MAKPESPLFNTRFIVGVAVILVGVLFTLDNLGIMETDRLFLYWPVVLILIGLTRLPSRDAGELTFALVAIGGGLWILLYNLEVTDLEPWGFFWPAVLILIGVNLAMGALRPGGAASAEGGARTDGFAFMSSVQRRSAEPAFEGGDLTAIMGSCEVDLRKAGIGGREPVVHVFALWGGIDILVPQGWRVESRVLPLLGSYDDSSEPAGGEDVPRLHLRGMAIMGGVEVKN